MTEAIVIVLDIGKSARHEADSSGVSFFEKAKLCASMIIERNIFSNSKDELGLILLGSEVTNNPLEYENIEIVHSLQLPSWNMVKSIAATKTPSAVDGDWLDGLIVALDFMKTSTEGKIYSGKKIVLLTNFRSNVSDDEIEHVINGIEQIDVVIMVVGPQFYNDDPEDKSLKSDDQLEGEKLIATIVSKNEDNVICGFEDAIPQLLRFERKKQRSVPWRAVLELGSSIKIPVAGYKKISEAKRIMVKNVVLPSEQKKLIPDDQAVISTNSFPIEEHRHPRKFEDDIAPVQRDYLYSTVADNPTSVDVKDVMEGFWFGSTIIPLSDDDRQGLSYQGGEKCLTILGFTHISNVPLRYHIGDGCMYFFPEDDENTMKAFSAFVHAMDSKEMVAIVRKVYRKNTCPQIGALFPKLNLKKNYECLVYISLPFSQDLRTLVFPPFLKDPGALTKDHLNAVDQLIDAMDLMSIENDYGNREEVYKSKSCLDPTEQHFCHFIARKIMKGDTVVKAADALETVKKMLVPMEEVSVKATPVLKSIGELFPLKEIKPKEGKRRAAADEFKTDVDMKVENKDPNGDKQQTTHAGPSNSSLVSKIRSMNPEDDFLKLIAQGSPFPHVCEMMQDIIMSMVGNAADEDEFNKPFKALSTLRKECLSRNPRIYNDWILEQKSSLLSRKKTFWDIIVKNHLGLISSEENDKSSVSAEEANAFITTDEDEEDNKPLESMDEDVDDLISGM